MSATTYRLAGTVLIVRLKLNLILRRSRFPPDTTLDDIIMGTLPMLTPKSFKFQAPPIDLQRCHAVYSDKLTS